MNFRFFRFPRLMPVEYDVRKHITTRRTECELNPETAITALVILVVAVVLGVIVWLGVSVGWLLTLSCVLILSNLISLVIKRFKSIEEAEERAMVEMIVYGAKDPCVATGGKIAAARTIWQRQEAAKKLNNWLWWPATLWLAIWRLSPQLDWRNRVDVTVKRELYLLWLIGLAPLVVVLYGFYELRTFTMALTVFVTHFGVGGVLWIDFTTRFHNN